MSQYLIKTLEKMLYGFGFGTGMGVSFYVLPSNTRNNLQNNDNVNDKNINLNQESFQNMGRELCRIEHDTSKYENINTKNQQYLYNKSLWGWGWYYNS